MVWKVLGQPGLGLEQVQDLHLDILMVLLLDLVLGLVRRLEQER